MNLLGLLSAVSLNSTRLGNMSISINLNIEPIAILISIISLAFVYFDYQRNRRDFRLNNAPLLIVEDETLEMNKERYFEKKFEPELLHKKFILDRRCVNEKVVHFSEITSEASVIPEKNHMSQLY